MKRGLSILIVIYLLCTPLLASYVVSQAQGLTKDVAYSYNDSDIIAVRALANNGTFYQLDQSYVFDNETMTFTIPSINFPTVTGTINSYGVYVQLNSSITDSDVYKIVVDFNYLGVGNLTAVKVEYYYESSWNVLTETKRDLKENDTVTFILETFESLRLANSEKMKIYCYWRDANNFPVDGDFIEMTVLFYKKDTILSKEQLINGILGIFMVVNFLSAIFATKMVDIDDLRKLLRKR